jgi:hypothetical protein
MTQPPPEQMALDGFEDAPVRRPRRRAPSGVPRWTRYAAKAPVKCDDCLAVLAEARGHGPATRSARWRRATGGTELLLCYAHAQQRRQEDGLNPLEVER